MAQYASIFDFETLGLVSKALRNLPATTVTQFLLKAGGTVDSYLRAGGYTLPLTGVLGTATTASTGFPDEIIDANVCIARFRLMVRRGFSPDDHDRNFRETYDDCIEWLEKVATGAVQLDVNADATPGVTGGRPRVRTKPKRDWLLHQDEAQSSGQTEVGS